MHELTIFFDGACPLCHKEMQHLYRADSLQKICFVDINTEGFESQYPEIDKEYANKILHGKLADGSLILGLDVTCRAWNLVGKGRWISFLRWPIVKPLADIGYLLFARYRYPISKWLTGQPRCPSCRLERKSH